MQCPKCGTQMRTIEYEGVQIDTCPSCEGEWLDGGELKAIVRTREKTFSPEEIQAVRKSIDEVKQVEENPAGHSYRCPRCGVDLVRVNYAVTSGVMIDRCRNCGGVWLDKDELEQVQYLAEQWEEKLSEDREKFGGVLAKIRDESSEGEEMGEGGIMFRAFRRTLLPFLFRKD